MGNNPLVIVFLDGDNDHEDDDDLGTNTRNGERSGVFKTVSEAPVRFCRKRRGGSRDPVLSCSCTKTPRLTMRVLIPRGSNSGETGSCGKNGERGQCDLAEEITSDQG